MERRLDRGEERHRLQCQHPDGGGLHHAAQGPGRRHRHQHQAALLQRHADPGHPGGFEGGRIVESNARTGEAVLNKVLDTDEGARRLGEVALVPYSSPISQSGLLFFNTLFDENASSHIALGQAYSKCIHGGGAMSEEELASRGIEQEPDPYRLDDRLGPGGCGWYHTGRQAEPLMRGGEWVTG